MNNAKKERNFVNYPGFRENIIARSVIKSDKEAWGRTCYDLSWRNDPKNMVQIFIAHGMMAMSISISTLLHVGDITMFFGT